MTPSADWLPVIFFAVAFVYSSVGFAGGSSYLAVLLLAGLPYDDIKPIALICNMIVASVAFHNYYKAGFFDAKKVFPFAVFSAPMAFLGAQVPIGKDIFIVLLGGSLALAGLRIFVLKKPEVRTRQLTRAAWWAYGLPIGALMGFFSGLIGIGGGIFLSPVLILLRWSSLKEASASAAFFIFVNSLAGFAGRLPGGIPPPPDIFLSLVVAVFLGGMLGSSLGARRFEEIWLRRVLAALVFCVSVNILIKVI
jgi:hypothetical protein